MNQVRIPQDSHLNLPQKVMGIFWQQLAGIGHDMGHSGITHNFHFAPRPGVATEIFRWGKVEQKPRQILRILRIRV